MITIFINISKAQSVEIQKVFDCRFYNLSIVESLNYISNLTGIRFAYTANTVNDSVRVNLEIENASISDLLDKFCKNAGLRYTNFGNQVLLKKNVSSSPKYKIQGIIAEAESASPVSYATISIPNTLTGCISDINGLFELELKQENLEDTLTFSSMGYERKFIPVKEFIQYKDKVVYLKEITYEIPPAHVSSRNFKKIIMGNGKGISRGSLYMDTNGQQAALWVENGGNYDGKILSLNYFLSSKGNTNAPFRVRLYRIDTITGEPGDDLINDILVVKPDVKKGWYNVDIRRYDIRVPENGFFIAMEGVFPNDYDFYVGDNYFVDLTAGDQVEYEEDDQNPEITYGQRLGYTRSKKDKNNTWHYSLSHTWFQLKKQSFGIMVSADIQIKKNKEK